MLKNHNLVEIQKYVNGQWFPSRMAFLKEGDIVRSKAHDDIEWIVHVLTGDACWSEEFQSHVAQVQLFKLKCGFEFVDDMTRVVLKQEEKNVRRQQTTDSH